jgi:FKBP-type peptidyl-prolyl cis-trans isomerase SlyD
MWDDKEAVLDGNHELAGKTLHFDVKVVSVRAAELSELAHGHPHQSGGCCGGGGGGCGCSSEAENPAKPKTSKDDQGAGGHDGCGCRH